MKHIKLYEYFTIEQRYELIKRGLTHVFKHLKYQTISISDETHKILEKIKDFDINNFNLISRDYGNSIYFDSNFKNIIEELNLTIDEKVDPNMELSFSIFKEYANQIDIDYILPIILRGTNLGYKLYKLIINTFDYISSNKHSTDYAQNLWYKLIIDVDYYSITSDKYTFCINKNISDQRLFEILNEIKIYMNKQHYLELLIIDDFLTKKINTLYGDINNYKK